MVTDVMVSLPEEFLVQVDELAQVEHRSRSELICEALQQYMETRQRAVRPGDRREVRAAVKAMDALSRISPGTGEDSTEDVRYWRDRRR